MIQVGILALQGDFAAHAASIKKAGAIPFLVTQKAHFEMIDGLIIPGGESTTLLKLLKYENLNSTLLEFGEKKPIFGTCAGAILMARKVCNPEQYSFGWVDIKIERNAYGRQVNSQITSISPENTFSQSMDDNLLEAVFIRAPRILETGLAVQMLAKHEGYPVLVEQGMHLVSTFHPELTANSCIHTYFLKKIRTHARIDAIS